MKILDIITEAQAQQVSPALEKVVADWLAKNNTKGLDTRVMSRYNPNMLTLFKKIMIWVPLVQLNLNLYALEQIAKEPIQTFQARSPEFASFTPEQRDTYIKEARDLYYGVFATQMLLPALTKWIVRGTPVVRELFALLEASFGKIGGKLGTIIKIFAVVGIEAFVAFLATPAGIQWMSTSIFMPIIRMSGSATAWTWDHIWPTIEKYTGLPIGDINPETGAAVKRDRNAGGFDSIQMTPHDEFRKSQDAMQQRLAANPNFNLAPGR